MHFLSLLDRSMRSNTPCWRPPGHDRFPGRNECFSKPQFDQVPRFGFRALPFDARQRYSLYEGVLGEEEYEDNRERNQC